MLKPLITVAPRVSRRGPLVSPPIRRQWGPIEFGCHILWRHPRITNKGGVISQEPFGCHILRWHPCINGPQYSVFS
jgi:hypothetical protein